MPRISSRHNPIVQRFRAAARGDTPGIVLLDGVHLITDAVSAGLHLDVVAISAEAESKPDVSALAGRAASLDAEVVSVTGSVLEALTPVRSTTGIVALGRRPVEDAARVFAGTPPLVVIAAGVQDPGNIGAIVRVAEAAGATGAITTATSADPFGWKALRGAMGSALRLPLARCPTAETAVDVARSHGCRIAATLPHGGTSMFDADLGGTMAVLIGGEGAGLPPQVLASADVQMTIPMEPPVESLNAAVTAALVLYEARRQRSRR